MPWLFRRRTVRRVVRASGQDWMRVPPLSPVVDPRAPVLGRLLDTPQVAGTEDLLRWADAGTALGDEPVRGAVTGVVRRRISAAPALEPRRRRLFGRSTGSPDQRLDGDDLVEESAVVDVMYDDSGEPAAGHGAVRRDTDDPSALPVEAQELGRRQVPVVLRVRPASLPLTTVSAETVGTPQESADPFRSIGPYERMLAQYEANDVVGLAALAGFSSVAAPPPDPAPAEPIPRTAPVVRRTLAESRRQGLQAATIAASTTESAESDGSASSEDVRDSGADQVGPGAPEVRGAVVGEVPVDDAEHLGRSDTGVDDGPAGPVPAEGLIARGSEPLLPASDGDEVRFRARPNAGPRPVEPNQARRPTEPSLEHRSAGPDLARSSAGPDSERRSAGPVGGVDSSASSRVREAAGLGEGLAAGSSFASLTVSGWLSSAGPVAGSVPARPFAVPTEAGSGTVPVPLRSAEAAAVADPNAAPTLGEPTTAAASTGPIAATDLGGPAAVPTSGGLTAAPTTDGSDAVDISTRPVDVGVLARPVDAAVFAGPGATPVSAGPSTEAMAAGPIAALAYAGPSGRPVYTGPMGRAVYAGPMGVSAYAGPVVGPVYTGPVVGSTYVEPVAAPGFAGAGAGPGSRWLGATPAPTGLSAGLYELPADSGSASGVPVLSELVHRPQVVAAPTDAVEEIELWSLERDAPELATAIGTAPLDVPQYVEHAYGNELPATSTVTQPSTVPQAPYHPAATEVPASSHGAAFQPERAEEQDSFERGPEWLLGLLADPGLLGRVAERLYPVVRRQLRSELLIDRERRGALADLR